MFSRAFKITQPIALLAGSFTFAFLLGEMVHEFGHYLGHMAYGTPGISVHLDPFGGSRIVSAAPLQNTVVGGVTSATGPLLNFFLATAVFLLVWRMRKPILFPLLLWGPVALVQEGVTFSLGFLTLGGDAEWITSLGVSQPVILLVGILFLLVGIGTIALLLPLAGVERDDPFWVKLLILVFGFCSFMMVRLIHSFLVSPEYILENLIPLVFSLLLAGSIVLIHKPLSRAVTSVIAAKSYVVGGSEVALALILGMSMFLIQAAVLN